MTKRRWPTEHALSVSFGYTLLLQQDALDTIGSAPFGSDHPLHLYLIGRRPRMTLETQSVVVTRETISGAIRKQVCESGETLHFVVPNTFGTEHLVVDAPFPGTSFTIRNTAGEVLLTGRSAMLAAADPRLHDHLLFEVLYVGQAYGRGGSRTAPLRLKSHSTLQRIYADTLNSAPDQDVWLLLFELEVCDVLSMDPADPDIRVSDEEDDRRNTTIAAAGIPESQVVSFTEAALIRYFQPRYNAAFRGTFPNAGHVVYRYCYEMDFNSIMINVETEHVATRLWSAAVEPRWSHFVYFPLHDPSRRRSIMDLPTRYRE